MIVEVRFYNTKTGIAQVNFEKTDNRCYVQIQEQGNIWIESNRHWIAREYPQIKADVKADPVVGWTW